MHTHGVGYANYLLEMPRASITHDRLHEVASRAASTARQKVAAIIGHECEEDISCAFIEPGRPLQATDVAEFRWASGNMDIPANLRVDKALYCNCPGPPRSFMTSIVVTSVLKALREKTPEWMKEDGADEVIVDAIASPKAIGRIPALFKVDEVEYIRCAHIEGVRWICIPTARPFRANELVEIDAADPKNVPDCLPKKRRQEDEGAAEISGANQPKFEQLVAMATWQAEQRRAASQGRALRTDNADAYFLRDPAEWPAGRAQFTVLLCKTGRGSEWQNNVTPVPLRELINDANRMV